MTLRLVGHLRQRRHQFFQRRPDPHLPGVSVAKRRLDDTGAARSPLRARRCERTASSATGPTGSAVAIARGASTTIRHPASGGHDPPAVLQRSGPSSARPRRRRRRPRARIRHGAGCAGTGAMRGRAAASGRLQMHGGTAPWHNCLGPTARLRVAAGTRPAILTGAERALGRKGCVFAKRHLCPEPDTGCACLLCKGMSGAARHRASGHTASGRRGPLLRGRSTEFFVCFKRAYLMSL